MWKENIGYVYIYCFCQFLSKKQKGKSSVLVIVEYLPNWKNDDTPDNSVQQKQECLGIYFWSCA